MKNTVDNLKEAFAGESQANRKYIAFGQKAEAEGFKNIGKLFRTIAEAETLHALGHLKALGLVKNTAENLQAAIDGETYEYTKMYPPMHEQAEKENHIAKRMFNFAMKAEKIHAEIYALALKAVKAGKDLDASEIYLCPVCGHIELKKPDQKCPICGLAADKYIQVN
ncbi:MAG: rubrerythrin [Candidatus Hydrogenedentes bacterium CG1_02_42_14]|nr:MAG: rubrerythrin [Candidatus Hydrogenedentes bacterium CG1_02_42_14]